MNRFNQNYSRSLDFNHTIVCDRKIADRLLLTPIAETDSLFSILNNDVCFNKLFPLPETLVDVRSFKYFGNCNEFEALSCYYMSLDDLQKEEVKKVLEKNNSILDMCNYWLRCSYYLTYYQQCKQPMDLAMREYQDFKEDYQDIKHKFKDVIEAGKVFFSNIKNYGVIFEEEWVKKYWGIKIDKVDYKYKATVSYDQAIDKYSISFTTNGYIPYGFINQYGTLIEDGDLNWYYTKDEYDGEHSFVKKNGIIFENCYLNSRSKTIGHLKQGVDSVYFSKSIDPYEI